jgi:hypothetical protein
VLFERVLFKRVAFERVGFERIVRKVRDSVIRSFRDPRATTGLNLLPQL